MKKWFRPPFCFFSCWTDPDGPGRTRMDPDRPRRTWTDPDGPGVDNLIISSCASPSDNLTSLSYSMPAFSANSFGLISLRNWKKLWNHDFCKSLKNNQFWHFCQKLKNAGLKNLKWPQCALFSKRKINSVIRAPNLMKHISRTTSYNFHS